MSKKPPKEEKGKDPKEEKDKGPGEEKEPEEGTGEDEDAGNTETKTGKKKKILMLGMIVIAVLALSGSGFFAYRKFFAARLHSKMKKGKTVHPALAGILLPLDPFVVNLTDPGRFLKVSMQVEVGSADDKKFLSKMKPQIDDAIITLLSSESMEALSTAEGKMQVKDGIILRVNQVAGSPMVKNVYFTQFIMQ